MEHEPILIEELDVAPTRVAPGLQRRSLVVIGLLAALVGYGFVASATEPDADPPAAPAPTSPTPAAPSPFPPEPAGSMIDQPAEAATIRGAIVPVAGSVPPQVERVRVVALAGRVVLAEQIVRPVEGRFDVRLVVALPGDGQPVPVTIVVRDASDASDADVDLVRRTVSVVQSSPVSVVEAQLDNGPTSPVLHLSGFAHHTVTGVTVEATGHRADASMVGWEWSADLTVPAGTDQVTVVVRWTDLGGSAGTTYLTVAPRSAVARP